MQYKYDLEETIDVPPFEDFFPLHNINFGKFLSQSSPPSIIIQYLNKRKKFEAKQKLHTKSGEEIIYLILENTILKNAITDAIKISTQQKLYMGSFTTLV